MDAASLVVRISAEGADSAISAIKNVGSAVDEAGRKIMGIGDTLMGWGGKLTAGVTVPLMALGTVAVTQFADFEQQVAVLDLVADGAAQSFGSLGEAAIKVGADTELVGITASEAAQAMTNFYKAGLSTTQIFGDLSGYMADNAELTGALRASIDLAAASELDLGQAAMYTAEIMRQFSLPFEDATEVVNTMVRVADAGAATVGGLAEGLQVFGPIAARMGYSVEDASIALGMLTDRGIKASEAGTMLRSIFTQLTSDTKPVVETLFELGVSLYDVQGQMKPMPTIMQELGDAMGNLSLEQQMLALNALADTRALTGLAIMTKEGQAGWDAYKAGLEGANDASDVSSARMDTLKGDLEQLGGSLEALSLTAIGPTAEETIRPLVQGVTDLVNALGGLDPDTLNFGVKIAAGLAAIGPGLVALGALTKVVGLAAVGFGALASPVGLVIGGLLALGAAMGPLNGALADIGIKLPTLGEAFAAAAEGVGTLKDAFKELGTVAGEEVGKLMLPEPEVDAGYEADFVNTYTGIFDKVKTGLANIFPGWNVFGNLADINAHRENAAAVAQSAAAALTTELGAIDWSPAATGMMAGMESVTVDPAVGTALAESVNQTIIAGMESVTVGPDVGQAMMDSISSSLEGAGLDTSGIMGQLFGADALAATEIDMSGLAAAVNTALAEALPAGMEGIDLSGVGTAIATSLGTDLSTALAGADFSSVGASLAAAFETADMSSVGAGIVTSLTASITAATGSLSAAGAAVVASLSAGITGAVGSLSAAGAAAAASFAAGVSAGAGAAAAAGAALAAAVKGAVGSIDLYSAGSNAGSSLAAGLLSQVGAVAAAAAALSAAAKTSTQKELQMKSPSRVFMEYGQLAAQGFAMGLSGQGVGGAPRVTLNINGASFGQQQGGAGLMRAIDDYLRLNGTLSRV